MGDFHGIVVEESIKDKDILEKTKVLSKKEGIWTLYKISFPENKLDEMIKIAQKCIKEDKWYIHFYMDDQLIVVFKKRSFLLSVGDRTSWDPAIDYGQSLGIPEDQMNFAPCRTEEEEW